MSHNGNSDPRPSSPGKRAAEPADAAAAGSSAADASGDLQAFVDTLSPAQVGWWGRAAFFGALGFLALAYVAYFLTFRGQGCCDQAAWGQFGDFIGGVANPVLGLFTLLGLAFTVWLQMRQVEMGRTQLRLANEQLELSRKELELTRRELERSADAQRQAADAMTGQLDQARRTADAQSEAAQALVNAAAHQLVTSKAAEKQAYLALVTAKAQAFTAALGVEAAQQERYAVLGSMSNASISRAESAAADESRKHIRALESEIRALSAEIRSLFWP